MPSIRLTRAMIEQAAAARELGGSDAVCARQAGATPHTFYRWLHFGQALRDYLDNGGQFEEPEYYRNWSSEAIFVIEKLGRELAETNGTLSREHRLYLKLWDELITATTSFVIECQKTVYRSAKQDPNWALRGLRWFHPDDYKDPPERHEITGADGVPIELVVRYENPPVVGDA